jgi:hypothetical protein
MALSKNNQLYENMAAQPSFFSFNRVVCLFNEREP